MVIKAFQKDNFGNWGSERIQDNVSGYLGQVSKLPFFDGFLLSDVVVTGTLIDIPHKLGRIPQGYIVTKRNVGEVIYSGTSNDKTIQLAASGTITADIWIY